MYRGDGLPAVAGLPFETTFEFELPADAMHSLDVEDNKITWRLEVAAGPGDPPRFHREFPIVVNPPPFVGSQVMSEGSLAIMLDRFAFEPGETLRGSYKLVTAELSRLEGVEVTVGWHTEGKGREARGVEHREVQRAGKGSLGGNGSGKLSAVLPASPPELRRRADQGPLGGQGPRQLLGLGTGHFRGGVHARACRACGRVILRGHNEVRRRSYPPVPAPIRRPSGRPVRSARPGPDRSGWAIQRPEASGPVTAGWLSGERRRQNVVQGDLAER